MVLCACVCVVSSSKSRSRSHDLEAASQAPGIPNPNLPPIRGKRAACPVGRILPFDRDDTFETSRTKRSSVEAVNFDCVQSFNPPYAFQNMLNHLLSLFRSECPRIMPRTLRTQFPSRVVDLATSFFGNDRLHLIRQFPMTYSRSRQVSRGTGSTLRPLKNDEPKDVIFEVRTAAKN